MTRKNKGNYCNDASQPQRITYSSALSLSDADCTGQCAEQEFSVHTLRGLRSEGLGKGAHQNSEEGDYQCPSSH